MFNFMWKFIVTCVFLYIISAILLGVFVAIGLANS